MKHWEVLVELESIGLDDIPTENLIELLEKLKIELEKRETDSRYQIDRDKANGWHTSYIQTTGSEIKIQNLIDPLILGDFFPEPIENPIFNLPLSNSLRLLPAPKEVFKLTCVAEENVLSYYLNGFRKGRLEDGDEITIKNIRYKFTQKVVPEHNCVEYYFGQTPSIKNNGEE